RLTFVGGQTTSHEQELRLRVFGKRAQETGPKVAARPILAQFRAVDTERNRHYTLAALLLKELLQPVPSYYRCIRPATDRALPTPDSMFGFARETQGNQAPQGGTHVTADGIGVIEVRADRNLGQTAGYPSGQ